MLSSVVKFNKAVFEYYVIHIGSKTKLEQIQNKLIGFKKLGQDNYPIVLNFDPDFDIESIKNLLTSLKEIATKVNVILHSIARNDNISTQEISGINVVDYANAIKSKHVYDKSLIFDEPVRSGIRLDNDGDIIINNFVSDNAEIVASGNIHVYGEARGRLIAGSTGDKNARIFVTKFNAELLAIGGIYKTMDKKPPETILGKPVMVFLDEKDRLNILPL